MTDLLLPIGVLATIAIGIGYIINIMTQYFLRRKMIDKGLVSGENADFLKNQKTDSKYSALKWGLIIFFSGIGLIIVNIVDRYGNSPLAFGIIAVSISLGFLTYYFAMKNQPE